MKRLLVALMVLFALAGVATAQSTLSVTLGDQPQQAAFLSRHPEILRWIGKHPEQTPRVADQSAAPNDRAKNNAINEWIVAWPVLATQLAHDPAQCLLWADDPHALAEIAKKGRKP